MADMDGGPGTKLGGFGRFTVTWTVRRWLPLVWAVVGIAAYSSFGAGRRVLRGALVPRPHA